MTQTQEHRPQSSAMRTNRPGLCLEKGMNLTNRWCHQHRSVLYMRFEEFFSQQRECTSVDTKVDIHYRIRDKVLNWPKSLLWKNLKELFGQPNIYHSPSILQAFSLFPVVKQGFPGGSDGKESACNAEDLGLIPVSGRSPGEGNGYPLLYSCLENSTEKPGGLQSMGLQGVRHN